MGKSIVSIQRELEKQRPFFKTMKRIANWHDAHPSPDPELSEKITVLHTNFERAQKVLDVQHAVEIKAIQQKQMDLREEAKALGKKHLSEKENMALGFAQIELDLINGKRTDLPEEIKPIAEENWATRLLDFFFPARI